jgi:hypothetical protein
MLAALELDVARLGGFVVSPLSFYEAVLAAVQPRQLLVLTEPCSSDHPIVRALQSSHGAVLQAGSVAEDLATLVLARQLAISGSTFSFMAALMGRAAAVHVPYAGSLSLIGAHNAQCLTPSSAMDSRFVYHDVYRRAVDSIAELFQLQQAQALAQEAQQGQAQAQPAAAEPKSLGARFAWRTDPKAPLPQRPAACPPSSAAGVPYYSLSFQQLADFYHNPACSSYYYPPQSEAEASEAAEHIQKTGQRALCTDTAWSFAV